MSETMYYEHLRPWQAPDQRFEPFIGDDFSEWYPIASRSRDATMLEKSNFDAALGALLDAAGAQGCDDTDGAVQVMTFNHWGCGYIDRLMVHKDAPPAILAAADDILKRLKNYPILDSSDYSAREWEYVKEAWADCSLDYRVELCREAGVSIFAARRTDRIPDDDNGEIYQRLRED
jgi:hypothetical protein